MRINTSQLHEVNKYKFMLPTEAKTSMGNELAHTIGNQDMPKYATIIVGCHGQKILME